MSAHNFTKKSLDCIEPGHLVLDLGAGEGTFAQMFVDRGAKVTAVDTKLPATLNTSIILKRMGVVELTKQTDIDRYDLIFMRNILQFLEKNWVIETLFLWLEEHLQPNGVMAIETFYHDPEPPFDRPMRSLYTLEELAKYFLSWEELLARQYDHRGLDMAGQSRHFFVADIIVRRVQ